MDIKQVRLIETALCVGQIQWPVEQIAGQPTHDVHNEQNTYNDDP